MSSDFSFLREPVRSRHVLNLARAAVSLTYAKYPVGDFPAQELRNISVSVSLDDAYGWAAAIEKARSEGLLKDYKRVELMLLSNTEDAYDEKTGSSDSFTGYSVEDIVEAAKEQDLHPAEYIKENFDAAMISIHFGN